MARRRAAQAALSGVSDMINQILQMRMKEESAKRMADYEANLNQTQARLQSDLRSREGMLSNPSQVDANPQLAASFNIKGQTPGQRQTPILQDIGKATSSATMPTATEVVRRGTAAGLPEDPYFKGPFPVIKVPNQAPRESVAYPIRNQRTPIEELIQAQQAKSGAIRTVEQTAEGAKPRIGVGPGGEPVTGFQTAGGQFTPTERTGTQEGGRKLDEMQAFEGDPAYVTTKAQVENEMERLTRGGAVARAGAVGRSQGYGSQMGLLTAQKEMGAGPWDPNNAANRATQGQLAIAGLVPMMVRDAASAGAMESRGIRLPYGAEMLTSFPMAQSIGLSSGLISQDSLTYMDKANAFSTQVGKILSGVTVREDEFPRFMSIFFATRADDPNRVRGKQLARNSFLASMSISAGPQGAYAGGAALGRAIKEGVVEATVIETLQLDNPDFLRGLSESIGPVPGVR